MWRRTFLAACIALLLPAVCAAQSVTVDNIVYAIDQEAHAAIVADYEGTPVDIVIPSAVEYEGEAYPVREIGEGAFHLSALKTVVLPETLQRIGGSAFSWCTAMSALDLPEGLESIGGGAFYYCVALQGMQLPQGVTEIEDGTFDNCRSLAYVTLPDGLKSIGSGAFENCSSLAAIDIPNGVSTIGKRAFLNCRSLAHVVLPSSLTEIAESTFYYCVSMETVDIPDGVTSIGEGAFIGCSSLLSVDVPDGVSVISDGTFDSCLSLESVTLPEGLQTIGENAFNGCFSLAAIHLPSTLTSIGKRAFGSCESLVAIDLPKGVTAIAEGLFQRCSALSSITLHEEVASIGEEAFVDCPLMEVDCLSAVPPFIAETSFDNITYARLVPNVPAGAEDAYRAAAGWKNFYASREVDGIAYAVHAESQTAYVSDADENIVVARILPVVNVEGADYPVVNVGDDAFSDCTLLESVDIPEGIGGIGWNAFWLCEKLSSVVLPSTTQMICDGAFYDCLLTDVTCLAMSPPSIAFGCFDDYVYRTAILHVPAGAVDDYRKDGEWSAFYNIVGDAEKFVGMDVLSVAPLARYADGVVITESPAIIDVYAPGGARVLHAADATSLSLEGLPRGIYVIGVEAEGRRQMMKVVW